MLRSALVHYVAFVHTVALRSITAAAREMGLPRPTVSRYLSRLEADLGVALLRRTTRSVRPTAAGQRLHDRVRPLLQQWTQAEAEASEEARVVRGALRISVLPLVAPLLGPVLQALATRHPELHVELVANVHLPDLHTEAFDAAIWGGEPQDGDLVVRALTTGNVGLVAAPTYLDGAGRPERVEDLARHRLLRGHGHDGTPRRSWPLVDGGRLRVDGGMVCNDAHALRILTEQGLGICLLSDLNVAESLAAGRLERVLHGIVGQTATVRLILAQRERMPGRLRAFVDAVAEHFDRPMG